MLISLLLAGAEVAQERAVGALRELPTEWSTVWKPRPPAAAPPAATTTATSPAATVAAREIVDAPAAAEAPKKARKVTLGSLLGNLPAFLRARRKLC